MRPRHKAAENAMTPTTTANTSQNSFNEAAA